MQFESRYYVIRLGQFELISSSFQNETWNVLVSQLQMAFSLASVCFFCQGEWNQKGLGSQETVFRNEIMECERPEDRITIIPESFLGLFQGRYPLSVPKMYLKRVPEV